MIHLDTSSLIRSLAAGTPEDSLLREWLRAGESFAVSAVVWAELLCGPVAEAHVELVARFVTETLPFTGAEATIAADLFNTSGRRRGSLADCMIAATAIGRGAAVATSNPSDFRRFEPAGLIVHAPRT